MAALDNWEGLDDNSDIEHRGLGQVWVGIGQDRRRLGSG